MARFDFVESASQGYRFTWRQRAALVRLAAWPLTVKIAFFLLVYVLGMEGNILRQGWVLLPTYFLEGWLVVTVIRLAVLPAGSTDRQSVSAAIILFVLVKLVVAVFAGLMSQPAMADLPEQNMPSDGMMFLAAAFTMLVLLWTFRFLWLYVPAAMGIPPGLFLRKIQGLQLSLYMLALWMLCFVPIALILLLVSNLLAGLFPPDGDVPARLYLYGMAIGQAVIEMTITLVSSIAMAHAVAQIMTGKPQQET